MAKKKELTTTDESNVPAYLQNVEHEGLTDNFDSSDIAIPQIKLLQGTSEECLNYDDAKAGNFWHTGMDLNLGDAVRFVVCARRKKYLLQAPMDDGQGILARSDDAVNWDRTGSWEVRIDKKTKTEWTISEINVAKSGLADWGTFDPDDENSPPAATLFYDYLVYLPDHADLGPAVMSLARSAIRKAKKGLNDKIQLHSSNGRPLQSVRFRAGVVSDQNDTGQDYFNWQFLGDGFATEEEFHSAKSFEGLLETSKIQGEGEDRHVKEDVEGKAAEAGI